MRSTLSLLTVFCGLLQANVSAGESRLWTRELTEPSGLYASPGLDIFLVAYKAVEDEVAQSSGVAVYDQKWNLLWRDAGVVFEEVSWRSGVLSARVAETGAGKGDGEEEPQGKWRVLDVHTGKTLREFGSYQEGKAVVNALDLYAEEAPAKEAWLGLAGPEWRVSGITGDGQYFTASDPMASGYSCSIYRKAEAPLYWERVAQCGGGSLIDGGYLLQGENLIPADPEEMAAFVSQKKLELKVQLKSLDDKEVWNRKISLNHELPAHALLDYPIAWYSGGKIVAYAGLVLKLFDLSGNEGGQIPYAPDMRTAKAQENRLFGADAPRLALSGDGVYFKFYCWDEEESGKFKRRVMKLYRGTFK